MGFHRLDRRACRWMAVIWLILLPACHSGPWSRAPDSATVDQIEAKLTKVPCIGSMSRWSRLYYYESHPTFFAEASHFTERARWYDYQKIQIQYFQAGFEGYRPGRVLYRGSPDIGIDDRDYNLVDGEYDIPSHTAHIWACGPNMSHDLPKDLGIIVR